MSNAQDNPIPVTGLKAFELASLRNSPLSVIRPGELGRSPMARGRFLLPQSGSVVVENLQVPGRDVAIRVDHAIECYFQHEGSVFQFHSRVLEMDTPVKLNDIMIVRGMRIAAPKSIERGNRRSIYRQSFASVQPPVDVSVWAVPITVLTADQLVACVPHDEPAAAGPQDEVEGFRVERGERLAVGIAAANTLYNLVPGLTLDQVRPVMKTPAHWKGELADASEFGIGLVIHRLVYSRLKVFQPLVARFSLPGADYATEFLIEIRRVQGVGDFNARVGGILLLDSLSAAEVRSSRDLAKFTLDLQRERARRIRETG